MKNLKEASAFSKKSPYDIYQEWEGIPAYKDFIVPDLLELELGDCERTGGKAAFVNMDDARWNLRHTSRRDCPGRAAQACAPHI